MVELDGIISKKSCSSLPTLRSWLITFYNIFLYIHNFPAYVPPLSQVEYQKCALIRGLALKFDWNPLAKIRGYLFHFGTGVPKH